jgi:solute carrier family 12 sodium/potassium/chloride transporter 2
MNTLFYTLFPFFGRAKRGDPSPEDAYKFGTFGGVFTPDVLTILGVIMYLRLGWVVGNAGILGALAIIILSKSITFCTGLSMSSITTNIKIGAGGAYSIISKSLGLEAGGSIGIPFYISLMLSAALYIVGFTQGWLWIFPDHPPMLVSFVAWSALLIISYISAHFAIRIQYLILGIIGASVFSFILTSNDPVSNSELIGTFKNATFWEVFAVFFPAATGIMAGANMSGDLKNPRRAIPLGTLTAIGSTFLIYVILAIVAWRFISPAELRDNQMAMTDNALFGPLVIMGILAATFSSALASMVGAHRVLQALADQKTVPLSKFFSRRNRKNEPRNAILFTGGCVAIALLAGDLNALASLITMFFLITYGMINLVVFIQQRMKIISFRPTFKIPSIVSFTGAVGSILIMFLINPIFSLVAISVIIGLYFWLGRRGLKADWGDIRGGMFLVLAERASQLASRFPRHQISWKPDLLLPVDDPKIWSKSLLFIRNITYPSGSIFAFTVTKEECEKTEKELGELLDPIKHQNILVNSTVIEDNTFLHGAKLVIQTLNAGAIRPNTLFLSIGKSDKKDNIIRELLEHATKFDMGAIVLRRHENLGFGMQKDVNLWLRDKSPNWHLAMLISLQLIQNWDGKLRLVTSTPDVQEKPRLNKFLQNMSDQARLPYLTEFHVLHGNFEENMLQAPKADINIFGMPEDPDFQFMRKTAERIKSSCLYVKDSGSENALV